MFIFVPKMDAVDFFETLLSVYQTTGCDIPEINIIAHYFGNVRNNKLHSKCRVDMELIFRNSIAILLVFI
jgi:hypothetical protein